MPEKYHTTTVDHSIMSIDCGRPDFGGGVQWGDLAVIVTHNRDGSTTHQPRIRIDRVWSDNGPAETFPAVERP